MKRPIHHGHVAVRFQDRLSAAGRRRVAEACSLDPAEQMQLPGEKFTIFSIAGDHTEAGYAKVLRALANHSSVVRAARLHRSGGLRFLATDRVWVGTRGKDRRGLNALLRRGGRLLESAGESEHLVRVPPQVCPWVASSRFTALRSVEWAQPDVLVVGRRFASVGAPQPAFRAIGAALAWALEPGRRDVVVAVLDDGVLASHPDLRGVIVASYDATGKGDATRPQPWDSHGTECAALIVGTGNGQAGIKGIAAGCGLAVVRIGYTPTRLGNYLTKASWLRRAVDWAWQHGVDVLSMSFGGGPPMKPVTAALDRARTLGRNGKGCVLVAAAGNDGTASVEYPASARGVIAVAATAANGRPASFSNRGQAVAIAAPGVNVYTATIPDPAEEEPGYYTTDSGTSLAVPQVAGAAALVLCSAPQLSGMGVRRRLCLTAARVPGLRFVDGRNDQVGAGRLDAARALQLSR